MFRVLQVIGAMDRGGAETLIMNLYRSIDRSEIQFDFMVHEERICDYDEEIRKLGGRIYRVPRLSGFNTLAYKKAFRAFFAEHAEHPVVHGHIGSGAALYLGEAKRAGRYTIAHSHNRNFPLSPAELAFRALSFPTRYIADYFLAASPDAGRDRFGKRFGDPRRSAVLKNGIKLDQYTCDPASHERAKEALGYGDLSVIGHVGRLDAQKNHSFLLETMAQLKRSMPAVKLVCVGRGPLMEQEVERASELGIADSVDFLGVRQDVPDLLRAFDVFVMPSIREGLPVAAVEAQAAGLPCVLSTDVPEATVISDLTQRVPLSAGPDGWASHLAELLVNLPTREDRIEQVRRQGFDIKQSADWLSDLYGSSQSRV